MKLSLILIADVFKSNAKEIETRRTPRRLDFLRADGMLGTYRCCHFFIDKAEECDIMRRMSGRIQLRTPAVSGAAPPAASGKRATSSGAVSVARKPACQAAFAPGVERTIYPCPTDRVSRV